MVHTVALRLSLENISTTYITCEDSLLEVEDAVRLWRTEEHLVIIVDYKSLSELDYGFVEMKDFLYFDANPWCTKFLNTLFYSSLLNGSGFDVRAQGCVGGPKDMPLSPAVAIEGASPWMGLATFQKVGAAVGKSKPCVHE
ncbi:unnamed protein product [Strongylus vulgaris]|uniref:Uncharacterized protein n=1 Tax=Strongylus vulgaris TaxID=40348 RepID=A0A3P7JKC9_STRVU|nr:unnamed protein product [Strongylus vulgaris]